MHLRARSIALVFVGGALGTAARAGLVQALPPRAGVPVAVLGINVVGAFVLGLLLELLQRGGEDRGRRRDLRLLAGTGILGGFTTYSALATDTATLLADGRPGTATAYALGTLVLGLAAALLGVLVGGRLAPRSGRAA